MTREQRKHEKKTAARKRMSPVRATPVAPIAPPPSTPTLPALPPAPARPLMDDLMEALAEHAGERDPAEQRTRQQAIIDKLIEQAADKGEARAAQLLITLKREADEAHAQGGAAQDAEEVSAEDEAILADYEGQMGQGTGSV